ncbi:MAG: HNH endonuclease, partial [Clostridium sp.]|nr:HNH endonuclease [Clostridium sp.]
MLEYECSECKNKGEWNGKQLQLQLHHKDGNRRNNTLSNLTFLCPNCHTQTENYGFKNVPHKPKKQYFCKECGKVITKDNRTGLCRCCANKKIFTKNI